MQDQNPYTASTNTAAIHDEEPAELRLAGRGERLGAFVIDIVILVAIVLPMMIFGGYFTGIMSGEKPAFTEQLMWSAIGFGVFILVQGWPLNNDGQTWGKKLLKMRIVDMDGRKPAFAKLILLRYGVSQVISLIPIGGFIYFLVDSCFIFGAPRRCIHDYIAGTRVVMAD
jgi:uncharacterized RDD family membrane protein YckC